MSNDVGSQAAVMDAVDVEVVSPPSEEYFEVVFSPKSSPTDSHDVVLGVNGEMLVIRRSDRVIVPGRFLEAADHALYPTFHQMPNEERKITSWVQTFPYTRIRRATKAEYDEQKGAGDKVTLQALKIQ